jgi:hypothetical protein
MNYVDIIPSLTHSIAPMLQRNVTKREAAKLGFY